MGTAGGYNKRGEDMIPTVWTIQQIIRVCAVLLESQERLEECRRQADYWEQHGDTGIAQRWHSQEIQAYELIQQCYQVLT